MNHGFDGIVAPVLHKERLNLLLLDVDGRYISLDSLAYKYIIYGLLTSIRKYIYIYISICVYICTHICNLSSGVSLIAGPQGTWNLRPSAAERVPSFKGPGGRWVCGVFAFKDSGEGCFGSKDSVKTDGGSPVHNKQAPWRKESHLALYSAQNY